MRDKVPVRERGPEGSGLRKARRKGESEGVMERGREWERERVGEWESEGGSSSFVETSEDREGERVSGELIWKYG